MVLEMSITDLLLKDRWIYQSLILLLGTLSKMSLQMNEPVYCIELDFERVLKRL